MRKIIQLLGILLLLTIHLKASDTLRVAAISKVFEDSIVIRFAPSNKLSFEKMMNEGVKVERCILPQIEQDVALNYSILIPQLKLKELEFWKSQFTTKDTAALIAAQLLFGENKFQENPDEVLNLIEKRDYQNSRFIYSLLSADKDPRVAEAMGLRFTDKDFKRNKKYIYRLTINNIESGLIADTCFILVDANEKSAKSKAPNIEAKILDSAVELTWYLNGGVGFTGFNLFRTDSSGKSKKLNSSIIMSPYKDLNGRLIYQHKDSIQNYIPYKYSIVGLDAFGDLSAPSTPIEVMAKDLTPPPPAQIIFAGDNGKHKMMLKWQHPQMMADLDGYIIHKALSIDGNYSPISKLLAKSDSIFIDTSASIYKGSFYKLLCLDTARNGSWSLPSYGFIADSIPPSKPKNLRAVIDTNSIVTLTWDLGNEQDLQGYRIFYANAIDHEFSNLTGQIYTDTIFKDTIQKRTLTRDIFYKVVAVDNNYNHSKPSDPIKLKRLDVIPPVAAIFEDVIVQDSAVLLKWINSSSLDLASIKLLYRPQGNENPWQELKSWTIKDSVSTFKTRNLKAKSWYEFTIESTDSSDLKSLCIQPAQIRTYDTGIRKGLTKIYGNYEASSKSVKISWNEILPQNARLLIYRKTPDSDGLSKYKVVASAKEFIDSDILKKGEYSYTIKVIYSDGAESLPAESISVAIN